MPHFTYESPDVENLMQGDLIKRTEAVEKTLLEYHPYFINNSENRYFIVITQSCDLVRRSGVCAARYITIAAVKKLNIAIKRYVESLHHDEGDKLLGISDARNKQKVRLFLERLFNNNEKDYFYLCADSSFHLREDYCSFLKLTVPLRSNEHYQELLDAKVLQLTQPFQHKLGYLVGHSYLRIGTQDWVPSGCTDQEFKDKLTKAIDEYKGVIWYSDEQYKYIKKELKLMGGEISLNMVEKIMEKGKKEKKDKTKEFLALVSGLLLELNVESETVDKFQHRFINNPDIRNRIK